MGSFCDMRDVERFIRSEEGERRRLACEQALAGRCIQAVSFSTSAEAVIIQIHLDNDHIISFAVPGLTVDDLRERFPETLEAEYFKDYPERQPL